MKNVSLYHSILTNAATNILFDSPIIVQDKVEAYYDAYCLLQEMLNSSKYQVTTIILKML